MPPSNEARLQAAERYSGLTDLCAPLCDATDAAPAARVSAAIGYRATIGNVTAMAQASATALPKAATSG
jgi:hypothetical protein